MIHVTTRPAPRAGAPVSRISKWDVNRAVRADRELAAPARLIMMMLSDRADADTGVIPDDYTPSRAELAAETGLSEGTVRTYLAKLEAEGWLVLRRPTVAEMVRHKKIRYALTVPTSTRKPSPTATERRAKRVSTAKAFAETVTDTVETRPPAGSAGDPEAGSAPDPLSLYDQTNNQTPPPPATDGPASEASPTRRSRGEGSEPPANPESVDLVLAQLDFAAEHVSRWTGARLRTRVAAALAAGWTDRQLVHELTRDLATARSRVGVVQARLAGLGQPPRPTPCPPPFVAPEAPRIAPERVRSYADQARAALARNRLAAAPAF